MAEINLLKHSGGHNFIQLGPKILVRLLIVALILLAGFYGWLFFDSRQTSAQIDQANKEMNLKYQSSFSIPGRSELLTRQQQLKSLEGLIGAHVYWSQLLPELAKVTLKSASYSSLKVGMGGTLDLSVKVPTLADLDKYMQIFDRDEFNKNFSNIRISGFSKVQSKESSEIQFNVRMDYKPELIKYQPTK